MLLGTFFTLFAAVTLAGALAFTLAGDRFLIRVGLALALCGTLGMLTLWQMPGIFFLLYLICGTSYVLMLLISRPAAPSRPLVSGRPARQLAAVAAVAALCVPLLRALNSPHAVQQFRTFALSPDSDSVLGQLTGPHLLTLLLTAVTLLVAGAVAGLVAWSGRDPVDGGPA